MSLTVSIQQAASNVLAAYLRTELTDVTTDQRWPDASKALPAKAITILMSGPRTEEKFDPYLSSTTELVPADPAQARFTWAVANITQSLQLDIWSTYEVVRDDILARLDDSLHKGESHTIGTFNSDPYRHGVLLALGNGWTGNADFTFDAPQVDQTPDAVNKSEFRATLRGEARMVLTWTGQSARAASIQFRQRLREVDVASGSYDLETITAIGTTHGTYP